MHPAMVMVSGVISGFCFYSAVAAMRARDYSWAALFAVLGGANVWSALTVG